MAIAVSDPFKVSGKLIRIAGTVILTEGGIITTFAHLVPHEKVPLMAISTNDLRTFVSGFGGPGAPEVEYRCMASKLYYAAYHDAKKIVDLCYPNWEVNSPGSNHARVAKVFEQAARSPSAHRPTLRKIGGWLRGAKKYRTDADYELTAAFGPKQADAAKVLCAKLRLEVSGLRSPGGAVLSTVKDVLPNPCTVSV